MTSERSDNIFTLASGFGIPLSPGAQEPVEDGTFREFKRQYLEWSDARDRALARHLSATPNLFRVYLPYSNRVFHLAAQVLWYLDEILIRDPVITRLTLLEERLEAQKIETCETLQFLSHFREPIEQGYLLLAGPSLAPLLPDERPPIVETLLENPQVKEALRRAVQCGYEVRPDSSGNPTGVYQVLLDSGGCLGFSMNVAGRTSVASPAIQIGERLPPIDPEELLKKGLNVDPLKQIEHLFPREIHRALHAAELAQQFEAGVLFDRDVDGVIVSEAHARVDESRQLAAVGVLDLTLPYVRGIPPERLSALRENIPEAFLDFRGRLLEVVKHSIAEGAKEKEEIRRRVEREVLPRVRDLDSELTGALRKARILALGLPLVSGAAVLIGVTAAVSTSALLAVGVAGGAGAIKAVADAVQADRRGAAHPFYFLWKARRGR